MRRVVYLSLLAVGACASPQQPDAEAPPAPALAHVAVEPAPPPAPEPAPLQAPQPDLARFEAWLADFRAEAAASGISKPTLDAALTGITPVERIVALDRGQPEFVQTFSDYVVRRLTPRRVEEGRFQLETHAALLDAVEQRYGVPKSVLVALWGLETNYGSVKGSLNIPASLATLAYDGRRGKFFRGQLLDALRIIDAGHVAAADMTGSWAGAMGHMQFMPSTFRAYAVDGDGDGRIDVWGSLPDAMYSAANYLKRAGWRADVPVAFQVRLPENFDWGEARIGHRLPASTWAARGVTCMSGDALPAAGVAAIVLPQGRQGPALMVFDNFDVVMDWNRSQNYALAVSLLADQLAGGDGLIVVGGAEVLSVSQLTALQQALNELGFDAGPPDGLLGPRTQTAIRHYQVMQRLPVDGYPSPELLAHVEQTHAAAAAADMLAPPPPLTFSNGETQ
ncbi:MAG TPA: lytic murein transglycosylase [Thiobacillaceae bacterium]|nr:lytic murein transglycosylase [Thiobacillaceae bacterium]